MSSSKEGDKFFCNVSRAESIVHHGNNLFAFAVDGRVDFVDGAIKIAQRTERTIFAGVVVFAEFRGLDFNATVQNFLGGRQQNFFRRNLRR